jgi:hypothetical protein
MHVFYKKFWTKFFLQACRFSECVTDSVNIQRACELEQIQWIGDGFIGLVTDSVNPHYNRKKVWDWDCGMQGRNTDGQNVGKMILILTWLASQVKSHVILVERGDKSRFLCHNPQITCQEHQLFWWQLIVDIGSGDVPTSLIGNAQEASQWTRTSWYLVVVT